jgi:hypothetical protein
MNWLQIGLFFSIIYMLYCVQQIKMILKSKGFDVDLLKGPVEDYRRFKRLIDTEDDPRRKNKYQNLLNGLHFALVGTVVIAAFLLSGSP